MQQSRATAVDLFSGMGGLSLGLKRAGFAVRAAIEVNKEFAKTYSANHPEVKLLTKDIRHVTGKEILEAAGSPAIDLVAGCPPCQGFSKLTDKSKGEDPRNALLQDMARIVTEMSPRAVMMENVPGLFKRGRDHLEMFVQAMRNAGYSPRYELVPLADYGVPQSRTRLVLLAGRGFEIDFPEKTHAKDGGKVGPLLPWVTLRDAISGFKKPVRLSEAFEDGGPQRHNWHVVRNLSEISIKRLKALRAGQSRSALPKRLRPPCHKETSAGFVNVYARMGWDVLPPTMTSGLLSPCMGRFGHPTQARTISVREAATLQTFPRSYRIKTDFAESACNMVGNAFPPKFAELAGASCLEALERHQSSRSA